MKNTELVERLHTLGGDTTPGPDPAFMARLGSELRQLDQVPALEGRKPRVHHRGIGGTTWLRVLTLAVPAGAVALAGALVALRPAPSHPRQVRTAGPGVSTPAPETQQPSAGERNDPAPPGAGGQPTPATGVHHGPATGTAGAPITTTTVEPIRHLVVPAPTDQSPQTTAAPSPSREPTTTTTAATTATTAPPASLSLHCTAGTDAGAPAVTCTWSASTTGAFHSYRLWREKPGTNRVVVFTSDNRTTTSYVDHDVQAGSGYGYWIEALDANGNVVARSAGSTVSCC
jgi:hypothetical protein